VAGPPLDRDEAREARREARRERVDQARETTRERVELAREATRERAERARLTTRRLLGLDRSGPPPPATLAGQPLHIWTIPNAIGLVRLALIPVFLALAFASESGTDALPAIIFAVVAWSDYADGMAARITGQYSRFGALLDPVVDRLLVIAGVVVCWHFELLPRWALAVLIVREVYLLIAGRYALRHGAELKINWPGRLAVWPTMSAIFFALVDLHTLALANLYVGLALSLLAAAMYTRDARAQIRASRERTVAPSSST
jgi:cardiolipin synthase